MKKAYISGAITGLPKHEVLRKFDIACSYVASLGYEPINPLHGHGIFDLESWDKHKPLIGWLG